MLVIPELNMIPVWVVPKRMRQVRVVPELILDQCMLLHVIACCFRTSTHRIKVGTVRILPEPI